MPGLYIITGSNGAGKSSVGSNYLPDHIRKNCEVFDGDKLFMQKQKLLWKQVDELVEGAILNNTDFAYEGHFINEATGDIPKRFKNNGYAIYIIFLGLTNTALSQLRVTDRAKLGGHYVQPAEVEANFYGNLEKPNKYYILFDIVTIIDTSQPKHTILAFLINGFIEYSVRVEDLPEWFTNGLPTIMQAILK